MRSSAIECGMDEVAVAMVMVMAMALASLE